MIYNENLKFTWDKFNNGEIAVCVCGYQEASSFCKELLKQGVVTTFCDGDKIFDEGYLPSDFMLSAVGPFTYSVEYKGLCYCPLNQEELPFVSYNQFLIDTCSGEYTKVTKEKDSNIEKVRGFEFVDRVFVDGTDSITDESLIYIKPKRSTKKSAGYDIFSPIDFKLAPGEDIVIKLGIKAYMQDDEYLMIVPRSGLGFKFYSRLANTVGIIDADYYNNEDNEGEIAVKIRNESEDKELIVEKGKAICQAIFMKYLLVDGDSTDEGGERKGGFGSTDNK